MLLPKLGRVVLSPEEYRKLQYTIFSRDGWRCRRCGSRQHLTLHHLMRRSWCRQDTTQNGVTLCATCHDLEKGKRILVIGTNADDPQGVIFRGKNDEPT